MDLLDDETGPGGNAHEFTVSEISGAVKRSIEDQFGRVRVRGEVGRVSRPSSGHLYFDLKDDRSVLAAITWKGQTAKLQTRPEEGIEVIATGRLTTFPGQSKYQMIVDQIEPAGAGALMVMLEKRRKALAAEGLFDDDRKRPLPYLPRVIGVVTSPSGAVIRDILHRLRDRFPTRVIIWPVAVQGQDCAPQVAQAIRGFNDLAPGGPIPRPDLLIVARGGGSLEDLWGFNEEIVVRAAADSRIPLISAVGHETDTTLIDFASDRRAPTPTAAAEMAVPVRSELVARLAEFGLRMMRGEQSRLQRQRQRLNDLGRALGRPQALTDPARQRFDLFAMRLEPGLRGFVRTRRERLNALPLSLSALRGHTEKKRIALDAASRQLDAQKRDLIRIRRERLGSLPLSLTALRGNAEKKRISLNGMSQRLEIAGHVQPRQMRERLRQLSQRLERERNLVLSDAARRLREWRDQMQKISARLAGGAARILPARREMVERLHRLRLTLGYEETLKRGFAVVHGPEGLIVSASAARGQARLDIQFKDGRIGVQPIGEDRTPEPDPKPANLKPAKPRRTKPDGQKSLF